MFEKQAMERINFLRNIVWTHLNQLSQQCVNSDEVSKFEKKCIFKDVASSDSDLVYYRLSLCVCVFSQLYEEVRKSLEQCDVQEDIEHFINLRRTGDKPPGMNSGMFINN